MITSKKLRLLLGALCVTGSMMSASAQSAVHPKAYYDGITYEWTDASGVVHTDAITTEATDARQIVALLKKIYCDPNIPGPTHTAYNSQGNRENEVYYGSQAGGWNISSSDVTAPYEDGYTVLMVAVKNDPLSVNNNDYGEMFTYESELINYFDKNVTSVLLLTDGLRIGSGENTGTVFNISGSYNRFFMISKGQSRKKQYTTSNTSRYGEQPPFKQMFEEFSPTDGGAGSQAEDFYKKMMAGDDYPVVHDCVSVIENKHFFSMDGNNATEYKSLTGLNIFIPDYRLKYYRDGSYDGRTMNPTGGYWEAKYAKYNPDHSPMVGIYNVKLAADAEATAAQEHVYDVTLDWTSSLDGMAHEGVPQNYTVYIVKVDEDGNEYNEELVVTGNTTYTYAVDQEEHSYTITYVVMAMPSDGEHDMFVAWSNQASVIIPGWNDFLNLTLNHAESDFVKGNEAKNYYRNFLNVQNEDENNALTTDRLADENSFTLYRIESTNPQYMIPVAHLNLTANYYGTSVNYTISYENQEKLSSYNVNVKTSGSLSVQNKVIDLSGIEFVDQFAANVAGNEHAERYDYVLALNNNDENKTTNTVEVPVQKINANIDGYYTLDEVLNDTEPSLTSNVKISNFNMMLSPNSSIYYYTIDRGNNVEPNDRMSKIQRRSNGTYEEQMGALTGEVYEPGEEITRIESVVYTGEYGDFMAYQPIVWTTGVRVNDNKENSYGSPVWKTGVGAVNLEIGGTRATTEYGEWKDNEGNKYAIYNPILKVTGTVPDYASAEYEPFMYRVWRECDQLRGYWINSLDVPMDYPWNTPPDHELIVNQQTTENEITVGSEDLESPDFNLLAFGAKIGADIKFKVRFYYKKVGDAFVRDANDEAPLYYVVEKTFNWENIPTAIAEINASKEVSKTYVNAQGVKSNKPFDGVNIVITHYSDGSTKTTKVVR